jgi:acetate kinase
MIMASDSNILAINSGSSSIKFALYRMGRNETLVFSGSVGKKAPSIRRRICESMEFWGFAWMEA